MNDYPDNPGPLPTLTLCNKLPPYNPIQGDGALGNQYRGMMYYTGSDKEELVTTLQNMLIALEYSIGPSGADGKFGNNTENAVKQFQENNKKCDGNELKIDGLVGPRTSDALNRAMVGIWYDHYQTPGELVDDKPYHTVTHDFLSEGLSIEPGEADEAIVVLARPTITRGDFLVLTKSGVNATTDFELTDRVVIQTSRGSIFRIQRQEGKVFIRPKVIVIGRFPDGTGGDPDIPIGFATLRVESNAGAARCDDMDVMIVNSPPFRTRTVIPFGEENTFYTIGIIANPAIQVAGKTGNEGPFVNDTIISDRPAFHRKVISVLESLFDRNEDVFRDSQIEPHIRIFTIFDDSLPSDTAYALLRRRSDSNYIAPRSEDLPNLLDTFLNNYQESADVLVLVTKDNRSRMAWFTTDTTTGTNFTYDGTNYVHGNGATTPGAFADSIYPVYRNDADKMTTLHEFLHAMSERTHGKIIDLYNNDIVAGLNANKKGRTAASSIPVQFAEYASTTYNSDRPNPPAYQGRGGLGYPGTDNINASYQPELRENSNPNLMDNYASATDPLQCKLDRLTYQFVIDRIRAKIK